jgi:lysophospholipase L1-like esterase
MSTRLKLVIAAALCLVIAIGVVLAVNAAKPTPGATGTGTRVAFYGDSYTLGTGASSPDKRWSTIVSRERNWNEFNPSVNGLGFVTNRADSGEGSGDLPSLVIESDPEIVFVTMGLNDNFSYDFSANEIRDQIGADLDRLKAALPDARFIVVEPFWYTDDRPSSVGVINGWVADAADAIGADYIPGASHWIEGHPEWMASDGLHPNDDGYAAMAERMDAELTKLGL